MRLHLKNNIYHALLGLTLCVCFVAPTLAQETTSIDLNSDYFEKEKSTINTWLSRIDEIKAAAETKTLTSIQTAEFREEVRDIKAGAQDLNDTIRDEITRVETLLNALTLNTEDNKSDSSEAPAATPSPLPLAELGATDQTDSPEKKVDQPKPSNASADRQVAAQKSKYQSQRIFLEDQLSKTELILALSNQLDDEFLTERARAFIDAVFDPLPHPFASSTWVNAAKQILGTLAEVQNYAQIWWSGNDGSSHSQDSQLRLAFIAVIILLAVLCRRMIRDRYPRPKTSHPKSQTDRVNAATVTVVLNILIPISTILAAYGAATIGAESNNVSEYIFPLALTYGVGFFVCAIGVASIATPPRLTGWGYLAVSKNRNRHVYRLLVLLAALTALDLIVVKFFEVAETPEEPVRSVYFFLTNVATGMLLIIFLMKRNWMSEPKLENASVSKQPEKRLGRVALPITTGIARMISLVTGLAIGALFFGYLPLGDYVIGNITMTMFFILAGYMLHMLADDLLARLAETEEDEKTIESGGENTTDKSLVMWSQLLIDVLILIGIVALTAMQWGIPRSDLASLFMSFVQGFEVGNTRISLIDIGIGILIFLSVLIATRLMQSALETKVFKASSIDSGIQDSIQTVIGYAGLILAALLGVGAIGFDLSSLALIAGALSVGIGFGLQTTVSNFVAGLILLIERPVKVGDLIAVDDELGTISKINARATEIITLDKASVIVPNESLVASKIRNLTHKDRLGRLNIPVGVAYGSDTDKVRKCLLETAAEHENVSKDPEPQVLFTDFGSSSLDMELRCYTTDITDGIRIRSDLRFAIDAKFREHGIEIPFPQRVIHHADKSTKDKEGHTQVAEEKPPTVDDDKSEK